MLLRLKYQIVSLHLENTEVPLLSLNSEISLRLRANLLWCRDIQALVIFWVSLKFWLITESKVVSHTVVWKQRILWRIHLKIQIHGPQSKPLFLPLFTFCALEYTVTNGVLRFTIVLLACNTSFNELITVECKDEAAFILYVILHIIFRVDIYNHGGCYSTYHLQTISA